MNILDSAMAGQASYVSIHTSLKECEQVDMTPVLLPAQPYRPVLAL